MAHLPERRVSIGLLGLGTVGSQVYQTLTQNFSPLQAKTGFSLQVEKILVRKPDKTRSVSVSQKLLTSRPEEVLNHPEIGLVVEMMGGVEPAATLIKRALEAGKSVVTANKAVMATHGLALLTTAERHGADLFFEASVAGAIPILRPLQESLATDHILEVAGIVNGTTNFILSKMTSEGCAYESALKEAQSLGYAEPDPHFDVSGMDASYKVAILAFLAFGFFARGEEVAHEGIAGIASEDIRYARELGYRVKLLAKASRSANRVALSVFPTLVPAHHPLYNVEGPYNAVLVKGERFGDLMFYGQGAGGVPTSTAIVSDIVQAARNLALGTNGKTLPKTSAEISLQPLESAVSRFYLRLEVEDRPGTLASLAQIFSGEDISFAAVIQKESNSSATDILFLTHKALEGAFGRALDKVRTLGFVREVRSVLRVE